MVYDFARSINLPQPPDEIRAYVYRDPEEIGLAWAEYSEYSHGSIEDSVDFRGTSPPRAGRDSIWVRVDYPDNEINEYRLGWLTHVAAHELVHAAYQSGIIGLNTGHSWFENNMLTQPVWNFWIAEGMADFYVNLALSHAGQRDYRQSRYMHIEPTTKLHVPLSDMELRLPELSEVEPRQCLYLCGFAAVELLASRVGLHRLTQYYASMRPRNTWKQSFEDSFGMSPDQFYELF